MISLNNISKKFHNLYALKDITLTIHPSKITGLIGLNGAGKTTLIRTIAGLYKPTTGNIVCNFISNITARKISLLSCEQGLYNSLTTKKTIEYFGILQDKDFHINATDIQELIQQLGLQAIYNEKIETLSSGWRQKVLILLTFMNDPQVILLDEPSNYLDFLGQRQLDALLHKAKDNGKYIVYASHNLYDIERKCDQILLLHNGELLFYKPKEEIYNLETEIMRVIV